MRTKDLATALEQWVAEHTVFQHYEHMPEYISKALPLVICEIQDDSRRDDNSELPNLSGYQQAYVRGRVAELLLMSDPEDPDSWSASQVLYDAVDDLATALRDDPTLGGRVKQASAYYTASYSPPVVQHADGTIARRAAFRITVGELVEVTP